MGKTHYCLLCDLTPAQVHYHSSYYNCDETYDELEPSIHIIFTRGLGFGFWLDKTRSSKKPISRSIIMPFCGDGLKMPLLCSLGLHKWQNYGERVEIYWKEPQFTTSRVRVRKWSTGTEHEQQVERESAWDTHHKTVFIGRECKRCGLKLRRKLTKNEDGTLSCVGWELDTQKRRKM